MLVLAGVGRRWFDGRERNTRARKVEQTRSPFKTGIALARVPDTPIGLTVLEWSVSFCAIGKGKQLEIISECHDNRACMLSPHQDPP